MIASKYRARSKSKEEHEWGEPEVKGCISSTNIARVEERNTLLNDPV